MFENRILCGLDFEIIYIFDTLQEHQTIATNATVSKVSDIENAL